jgi:enamine deaminase RidA (YjgF/YER057c/UK114 family)
LVFLAGQTGYQPGGRIVDGGVVPQFERALSNLLAALRAAGGDPADLVSLTIYAVDLEDYRAHGREIGDVWRRLCGREYPAMAAVGVARLWDADALVEVQGAAVVEAAH